MAQNITQHIYDREEIAYNSAVFLVLALRASPQPYYYLKNYAACV